VRISENPGPSCTKTPVQQDKVRDRCWTLQVTGVWGDKLILPLNGPDPNSGDVPDGCCRRPG